jgi:hypothetical protein
MILNGQAGENKCFAKKTFKIIHGIHDYVEHMKMDLTKCNKFNCIKMEQFNNQI